MQLIKQFERQTFLCINRVNSSRRSFDRRVHIARHFASGNKLKIDYLAFYRRRTRFRNRGHFIRTLFVSFKTKQISHFSSLFLNFFSQCSARDVQVRQQHLLGFNQSGRRTAFHPLNSFDSLLYPNQIVLPTLGTNTNTNIQTCCL